MVKRPAYVTFMIFFSYAPTRAVLLIVSVARPDYANESFPQ